METSPRNKDIFFHLKDLLMMVIRVYLALITATLIALFCLSPFLLAQTFDNTLFLWGLCFTGPLTIAIVAKILTSVFDIDLK